MASATLLPISKSFLGRIQTPKNIRLIILQHALRDSVEFVKLAQNVGITVSAFIVKPNSKESNSVEAIRKMGVAIIEESYEILESTNILDDLLISEAKLACENGQQICIIDVGGYFCAPVKRASRQVRDQIRGLVEVTTFGHNRYITSQVDIPIPVLSIARSPLKVAEAKHVGETVVQATEDLLRECGLILDGKKFGLIGYGMIGLRIASAMKLRGHSVFVGDISHSAQLQAKLENLECLRIPDLLSTCDIVFSATARQSVSVEAIRGAKDGIFLVSGGSKANEFDVQGIVDNTVDVEELAPNVEKHLLKWGKCCVLANKGKAVNFLKGGSPEEIMDIVFAEQVECLNHFFGANLPINSVSELPGNKRDAIASEWIDLQQQDGIPLFSTDAKISRHE